MEFLLVKMAAIVMIPDGPHGQELLLLLLGDLEFVLLRRGGLDQLQHCGC